MCVYIYYMNEQELLDYLHEKRTIADVAIFMGVAYSTASQKLQLLMSKNKLKKIANGRGTYYQNV